MNIFIAFIGGLFTLILFTTIMAIVLNNKTYKNTTMIARQTGNSPDDVVWIKDRFRVRNRDGFWIIQFKKLREKTSSVPGKFWTKFIAEKQTNKILKFTDEEWKTRDISRLIRRGILFYETNEGEFHPMTIEYDRDGAKLHVISQDNRQFLINEIKDINSLTKNRFKEMLLLGAIILGIFVLAVIFILGIIYMKESAQTSLGQSQQACIDYYRVVANITDAANGQPQFLEQATNILVNQ